MEHWIVAPKVTDEGHTASASTGASVEVAVMVGEGVRLPLTSSVAVGVAVGDTVAVGARVPMGVAVAVETSVAV
jgi:UDP-3-O-[3-hydroxymyristoyl] glucosamine N-acyltransferase